MELTNPWLGSLAKKSQLLFSLSKEMFQYVFNTSCKAGENEGQTDQNKQEEMEKTQL